MTNSPPSSLFYRTRLGQAAKAHMLIVAHCRSCRRLRTYLAGDLLAVGYHAESFVCDLFGPYCPHCGQGWRWRVRERHPNSDDVGHTVIRRPAGERRIQLWRDEFYGPPLKDGTDAT